MTTGSISLALSVAVVLSGVAACSSGYGDTPTNPVPTPAAVVSIDSLRDTLYGGEVVSVVVRYRGADGREIPGRIPTLTSSNTAVALIDPVGRLRAVNPGTADITATIDGASATRRVTVSAAEAVYHLTRYDGQTLPTVLSVDSVFVNGVVQEREIQVDSGVLRLTGGGIDASWASDLRYVWYDVTKGPHGERQLTVLFTLNDRDVGRLLYGFQGELLLVSSQTLGRMHLGQPNATGLLLRYALYALSGVQANVSIDFAR
jgi:hypothetical protein